MIGRMKKANNFLDPEVQPLGGVAHFLLDFSWTLVWRC